MNSYSMAEEYLKLLTEEGIALKETESSTKSSKIFKAISKMRVSSSKKGEPIMERLRATQVPCIREQNKIILSGMREGSWQEDSFAYLSQNARSICDYASAEKYVDIGLHEYENSVELLQEKGNVLIGQNKYSEAIKVYNQALILLSKQTSQKSKEQRFSVLFNLGVAQFELEDYQMAIQSLKQSIEYCPHDEEAVLQLVDVYLAVGQQQAAIDTLYGLIRVEPTEPVDAYIELSRILLTVCDEKESDRVMESYIQILETVSTVEQIIAVYIKYAQMAIISNHPLKALQILNNASLQTSDASNLMGMLLVPQAQVQSALGNHKESINLLRQYILSPVQSDVLSVHQALYLLALEYLHINDLDQAVSSFNAAISTSRNVLSSQATYQFSLALTLFQNGKYQSSQEQQQVIQSLLELARRNCSDSILPVLILQGNILYQINEHEQAIKVYSEALGMTQAKNEYRFKKAMGVYYLHPAYKQEQEKIDMSSQQQVKEFLKKQIETLQEKAKSNKSNSNDNQGK